MLGYTVAQILAAEDVALQRFGQLPLMMRAATAVAVTAVRELSSPLPGRRVVLLVGVGNNGGDALFAGANLARRRIRVDAICTDPDRAHSAGRAALHRTGGRIVALDAAPSVLAAADLIIDGVVGIGARPPLRADAARLVELANAAPGRRLAVDLPSGLDPDSGTEQGPVVRADITVTFGGAKTGLLLSDTVGRLDVVDLEFPLVGGPHDVVALTDADVRLPAPSTAANKYSNGVLGIAAGSSGYPGAAVLSVGGAVRTRPGMVRFAGSAKDAVLARWPEVVAGPSVAEAGRVQAWVVGPGFGTDTTALAELTSVLRTDVPVLVDADGLRLVAANPELIARPHSTVLTPHSGEFAALFPDLDPASRLASPRAAAARSGAVVLLKGHRTVIAAPDGRTAITLSGTPWLATAGSGDVLSGVIGSLLAAGLDAFEAATLGAFLHGRAGEHAEAAGQAGAQELLRYLPGKYPR